MPPIESEALALDFDVAVTSHLELFERKRAAAERRELALLIAHVIQTGALPDSEEGGD